MKEKLKTSRKKMSPAVLKLDAVIDNILAFASATPGKIFSTLLFPDSVKKVITYSDIVTNAARFANYYRARGIERRQVVIIILQHSAELIYAFVGALLLGAIPSIFAFPSSKTSKQTYRNTLELLLKVCDTKFVLTDAALARELPAVSEMPGLSLLLEAAFRDYPDRFDALTYSPNDIVLLQHSSGTTGLKKGVALSNQAVINQLRNYAEAIGLEPQDKIVSWLPLYHDMGLIACFVLPLVSGVPLVMMSPFDWVANPIWLFEAISEEKATLCWLPNFAYNFLASNIRPEQMDGWDLGSVRAFVNCAEPIRSESHQIFYERFRRAGLRRESLTTCYAMAENTFAITQGGVAAPVKEEEIDQSLFSTKHVAQPANATTATRRPVVSSGTLIRNNAVRIVDENRRDMPDRMVGEIAIQSDSMLTEYYHRPDLTAAALVDGWYFTGDLGYMADGHLFVTGRKKDMIIVAGKNIYPQDLEDIVSSIPGVYPGRVVSFGIFNEELGTEDVAILAETEVKDEAEQLRIKLRIAKEVREKLECTANDIALVPHMWLLKSSSGKIARAANREKYLKEWKGHVVS